MRLQIITKDSPLLPILERIYIDSFPPEERRPWSDIATRDEIMLIGIFDPDDQELPSGFFTLWDLDSFFYIEHFAVDPARRDRGIGSAALTMLADTHAAGKPMLIEVERAATSPQAERRIQFYKRCGFTPHHTHHYVQPSYGPGLPPVSLMLMTTDTIDLAAATRALYHQVYGVHHD